MKRTESRPTLPPTKAERAALARAEAAFATAERGSWAEQQTAFLAANIREPLTNRVVFDTTAELHAYIQEI